VKKKKKKLWSERHLERSHGEPAENERKAAVSAREAAESERERPRRVSDARRMRVDGFRMGRACVDIGHGMRGQDLRRSEGCWLVPK
jgi:hypothetical protein